MLTLHTQISRLGPMSLAPISLALAGTPTTFAINNTIGLNPEWWGIIPLSAGNTDLPGNG
jgi:hypothetical protein